MSKLGLALGAALATLAASAPAGVTRAAESPPAPAYGAPISLEQARQVVAAAEAEAKRRGVAICVTVVDSAGFVVLEERMTGATMASAETSFLKAKSAVLWRRSTASWLPAVEATHGAVLAYAHVYPSAGGEMIVSDGRIVGGVGIGGSGPDEAEISKIASSALR